MNIGTGSLGLQGLVKQQREVLPTEATANAIKPALGGTKAESAKPFSKVLKDKEENTSTTQSSDQPEETKGPTQNKIRGRVESKAKSPQKVPSNSDSSFDAKPIDSELEIKDGPWSVKGAPVSPKVASAVDVELEEAAGEIPVDQAAMMKFLIQMQAELGIEPQDILASMDQLTAQDLLKAPEDTMAQVLNGLELPEGERARAGELYQTMLKETATANLSQLVKQTGKAVDMKVVGPEEAKQLKLLASLERMNQQFFVEKNLKSSSTELNVDGGGQPVDQSMLKGPALATPLAVPVQQHSVQKNLEPNKNDGFKMPDFFPVAAAPAAMPTVTEPSVDIIAKTQSVLGSQPVLASPAGKTSLESVGPFQSPKNKGSLDAFAASLGAVPVTVDVEDGADLGDSGDQTQEDASLFQPLQTQPQVKTNNLFNQAMFAAPVAPKQGDDTANVRNLIQGAQILIQKGGGEMKIKMQPEGMGNVDLKVAVNQGKVDIQMLTDNTDTKKLLESGLSDLRESLMGHRLNVDHLKVDVAQKFQPDLGSQLDQQQREMARDFLGQFRQQNQGNRNGFMDMTGMRNYGAGPKAKGPSDVPAANRARETSRRLDLVA